MAEDLEFLIGPWIEGTQLTWSLCNQGDAPVPQWYSVGDYTVWDWPNQGNAPAIPTETSRATIPIEPKAMYRAEVDVSGWAYRLNQASYVVQISFTRPYHHSRELQFNVSGTLLIPIGEVTY